MSTLSNILDLASEIDAGKTAEVSQDAARVLDMAGVKMGSFTIRNISPGRYSYLFEFCGLEQEFYSDEGDNHTLGSFLDSIPWADAREGDAQGIVDEMKTCLDMQAWCCYDGAKWLDD